MKDGMSAVRVYDTRRCRLCAHRVDWRTDGNDAQAPRWPGIGTILDFGLCEHFKHFEYLDIAPQRVRPSA